VAITSAAVLSLTMGHRRPNRPTEQARVAPTRRPTLTEDHLRDTVIAYLQHYHEQRPHQGIGNVPIGPWTVGSGEIVCDESLHGLLKSFRRAA
jgi:hypothetical protein